MPAHAAVRRFGLPVANLIALVAIAACANAASVSWPVNHVLRSGQTYWWLQLLAMAILVWALQRCSHWRQAGAVGWLFATLWLSATFWWLYVSMHTYGGLPAALAALAVMALAATLGLYYAAACAVYWRFSKYHPRFAAVAFAALWTLAEMARGTWFTGFGWGAVAYAHIEGPLAGFAPWVGAYGIGALAAWAAASLALFWRSTWVQRLSAGGILVLGLLLPVAQPVWTTDAGTLSVTLLQGNIPQDEKFEPGSGVPLALQWYGEQLQANQSDLVVAPETAIALLPQQLPPGYWDALAARFSQGNQSALVGIPLGDFAQGYTNAVVAFGPSHPEGWRYEKHHLVPFGEFIPPLFKWFTAMMNIPLGDFNRGALGQASYAFKGQRLAPNICYEDLFGEELGVRFLDPEQAPTVFVNVSNIGWFGDTVAIDQHLQISRMRALEFERAFVRATNTGATAILDHRAVIMAALPRQTRAVLQGQVQGRNGITPYAWWVARWGLWPLWSLALGLLLWTARKPPPI